MTLTSNPSSVAADPDLLANVQGDLLRPYNMRFLRHLVVRVEDAIAARHFLRSVIDESSGVPQITVARQWSSKPATCMNVGIAAGGLTALGLGPKSLATFPPEYRLGAAARANKVGDVGASAPEHWRDGFGDVDMVHLMWTVQAEAESELHAVCAHLEELWKGSGAFSVTSRLDGARLPDALTGEPTHDVHFGYRDDITQPRFELADGVYAGLADKQPIVPVGALIQDEGATSFADVKWRVPALVSASGEDRDLSLGGCFNAFRVMEQDVDAFENFLEETSAKLGWNKEYLAAKLMGRWRNGVPIVLTPDHDTWSDPAATMPDFADVTLVDGGALTEETLNDFNYPDEREGDLALEGRPCPVGAHIRRANPRSGRIVQRSANHTRPVVRRGIPYGPPFDPKDRHDGHKRGLLGSFFCGSLIAQFEAIMYDWMNLSLQDPRITGSNCPIIGANDERSSRFDIPINIADPERPGDPNVVTIRGFPRFVQTVGSAYLFYPGVSGLRLLADQGKGRST